MSYVRNAFTVTQKILETKWISCEKKSGKKQAHFKSTDTPKYSKLCMYRYGKLTFSYSFFSVWTHKLRFLAKLLHIPKRAKNAIIDRKFRVFPVFFRFFSFFSVCFGLFRLFRFYTETDRVSMFRLNWNKQETHPNSLKESIFGYFSEHLGLFLFVMKQFCLFQLFR